MYRSGARCRNTHVSLARVTGITCLQRSHFRSVSVLFRREPFETETKRFHEGKSLMRVPIRVRVSFLSSHSQSPFFTILAPCVFVIQAMGSLRIAAEKRDLRYEGLKDCHLDRKSLRLLILTDLLEG